MKVNRSAYWLIAAGTIAFVVVTAQLWPPRTHAWSPAEQELLRSLWLESLSPLPPDPGNAVGDDLRAAELGHALFFDNRMSAINAVSCATCHRPELRFTDGIEKGRGIGLARRNTRSIVGTAYSPWQYWDGRRDSQWAQALVPIEEPAEHGGSREQAVKLIATDAELRSHYEAIFGQLPGLDAQPDVDRVFANIGKAIAAYERLLMPGPSRFDDYVGAVLDGDRERAAEIFSDDEADGLRLFIGDAQCTQCHNGPLLTNHEFHNTGVLSFPGEVPDKGRADGVREVLVDPFNCLGEFSDAGAEDCAELHFARGGPDLLGAFRTPSLRNLDRTAPYQHKGQHATLTEVLEHYNEAPPAMIGHNEAKPLDLTTAELGQLEAFLDTLAAPLATAREWLNPPVPAGQKDNQ